MVRPVVSSVQTHSIEIHWHAPFRSKNLGKAYVCVSYTPCPSPLARPNHPPPSAGSQRTPTEDPEAGQLLSSALLHVSQILPVTSTAAPQLLALGFGWVSLEMDIRPTSSGALSTPTPQADTNMWNTTSPEVACNGIKERFSILCCQFSFLHRLQGGWLAAKFNIHMNEPLLLGFPNRTIPPLLLDLWPLLVPAC